LIFSDPFQAAAEYIGVPANTESETSNIRIPKSKTNKTAKMSKNYSKIKLHNFNLKSKEFTAE